MTRLILAVCFALALTLCLSAVSSAHKVNLFAYVDGNSVVTDSGYSRSKRVHDGTIEVYDASTGQMLLSGPTDDNGKFDFEIPKEARANRMNLRLLLKAGTGHQAEWTVKYDEYGAAKGPFAAAKADHGHSAVADPQGTTDVTEVETIVRRELEPVKRMLADLSQSGPGVTEIIGGIGYILGLFGIVAYMKSRKS
ncbi:MAG: hypothetical protein OCC46_02050 [Pseudodesulfovibrio sp.]